MRTANSLYLLDHLLLKIQIKLNDHDFNLVDKSTSIISNRRIGRHRLESICRLLTSSRGIILQTHFIQQSGLNSHEMIQTFFIYHFAFDISPAKLVIQQTNQQNQQTHHFKFHQQNQEYLSQLTFYKPSMIQIIQHQQQEQQEQDNTCHQKVQQILNFVIFFLIIASWQDQVPIAFQLQEYQRHNQKHNYLFLKDFHQRSQLQNRSFL